MGENIKKGFNKSVINWYPGHMAKTKREIKEKLNLIDLVYEVIDARMPYSSKIVDLDSLVKNKPRILIMTKYDLCDKKITDSFIQKYEREGYQVIPVDLKNNKNVDRIIQKSHVIMDEMNDLRKNKGLKPRNIRVLIVGVPNVGKSTLINRLVGKKATNVGDKPGVTKTVSWIRIHKDIELLDSPGILWPKLEDQEAAFTLAALSSIKEEILNLQELSAFILRKVYQLYPQYLEKRYGILNLSEDLIEEYQLIGKKRGCLIKGGQLDYDKVYTLIIHDFKEGLLGPMTLDRIRNW